MVLQGFFSTATADIEILDVNHAPVVNEEQSFYLEENAAPGTCVKPKSHDLDTVIAWDPDGTADQDGLSWRVEWVAVGGVKPNMSLLFEITDGGRICVAEGVDSYPWTTLLNYEGHSFYSTGSEPAFYEVEVIVTDRGVNGSALEGSASVTIDLWNQNDPPRLNDTSRSTKSLAERGSRVGSSQLVGEDQDVDDRSKLNYTLLDDGGSNQLFDITPDGTVVLAKEAPEVEEGEERFTITVEVKDPHGLRDTATVTLSIVADNNAPVMDDQTFKIPEGHPLGVVDDATIIYSDEDSKNSHTLFVTGWHPSTAESMVDVNKDGEIKIVGEGLSFAEEPKIYMDVVVEDDGIGRLTDSAVITIDVLDRPNKPSINTSSLSVDELVPIGTHVGVVEVSDPDRNEDHTFRILDILPHHPQRPETPFVVSETTGEVKTNSPMDFEAEWFQGSLSGRYYVLNITVTDKDGLTDNTELKIDVGDLNERPYIGSGATSNGIFWFQIEEDASESSNPRELFVHASQESSPPDYVHVLDPDSSTVSHGKLSLEIVEGDSDGIWGITDEDKPSLQLKGHLDYEDVDFYELRILVSDGGEPALATNVTAIVIVNDIDDMSIDSFNVSEDIPTVGGDALRITGRNLGPTASKLQRRGATAEDVIVHGGVGREVTEWAVEFESEHCKIAVPNTEIICTAPPGVGSQIRWRFDVDDSATLQDTPSTAVPSGGADIVSAVEEWLTVVSNFGYQPPRLHGVYVNAASPQGLSTAGGEKLVIAGENFGPFSNTSKDILVDLEIVSEFVEAVEKTDGTVAEIERKESYSGIGCRLSIAHVEVICESPPGVGNALEHRLTVGDDGLDSSAAAASALLDGSLSEDSTLSRLMERSTMSLLLASSYAPPSLSQVQLPEAERCNLNTRGGQRILLMGKNLGDMDTRVFAFAVQFEIAVESPGSSWSGNATVDLQSPIVGVAASSCEVEVNHEQIQCETPPGVGVGYVWHVLVGGQQSSVKEFFNASSIPVAELDNITTAYAAPRITGVEGPGVRNADTAGGQTVRIIGNSFGQPSTGDPLYEEYERGYDDLDLWSYARFDIRRQLEHLYEFRIFFGRAETLFPAQESGARYSNSPFFSPHAFLNARFELQNCLVISHSRIECETPEGVGESFVYVLRIGGQASDVYYGVQNASSYHPPIVSFYRSLEAEDALAFVPFDTRGGEGILIEGRNFGAKTDYIDRVVYGDDSSERRTITSYDGDQVAIGGFDEFEAENCKIKEKHKQIVCMTAPGAGTRLTWSLFIDGQRSVAPSTSYELPVIGALTGEASQHASTFGGEEITVVGNGFGPSSDFRWEDPRGDSGTLNHTFLEWVKYGPTGEEYTAERCRVLNHSTIKCTTVPGSGVDHVWKVKVEGQIGPASTIRWSYADPVIYDISPPSGPTDGAVLITVIGRNFATFDPKTTAYIRFAKWNKWIPTRNHHTVSRDGEQVEQMQFVLPEGAGVNRSVEVVLKMEDSSLGTSSDPLFSNEALFSYEKPVPRTMVREDAGSEWRILLKGKNFGSCDAVGMVSKNNGILPREPRVKEGNRIRSWTHDVIELMLHDVEGEFNILTARVVSPGHPNRGFPILFPTGGRPNHDNEDGLFYESKEIQLQAVQPSFQEGHPFERTPPDLPTRGGMVISFPIYDVRNDTTSTEVNVGQPQIFANVEGVSTPILPRERNTTCELLKNSPRVVDPDNNEYEIICSTPEGQGFEVDMTVTLETQTSAPIKLDYARPAVSGIAVVGFKNYDVPQQRLSIVENDFEDLVTVNGIPFENHPHNQVDLDRSPNADHTITFSGQDMGITVSREDDGSTFIAEVPTFGALIMLFGDSFGITGFFSKFPDTRPSVRKSVDLQFCGHFLSTLVHPQ
eukprot:gb/GECG01016367.1/.p1 GENE.gb/GECG01016367.1/~~gb/GECG01016367.1/.p1  ORF type:complete len:1880 (+),score=236.15 gb/GECG01016367.1/:1-5640(+)